VSKTIYRVFLERILRQLKSVGCYDFASSDREKIEFVIFLIERELNDDKSSSRMLG
jgi:hypothetical protein